MPSSPVPRPRPGDPHGSRSVPWRASRVEEGPDVGLVQALAAAGWTVHERPGAPDGVVARDDAGTECSIHRVTVPGASDARAALVEHLRVLAEDHEHLVTVRAVVETGDAALVVLVDHVDGLRLDELVAAREPFSAAEAVTVLVPVAQALAALHRTGRSHGQLDARAVVVSSGGRAVVRPPLVPATGPLADDVRDLARLALDLVPPPASSHPAQPAPTDPGEARDLAALHAELVVALRDDPAARPAAGTFAARCYDAVEPRPVAMPDAARLVAGALGARRRGGTPAGVDRETVPRVGTDRRLAREPAGAGTRVRPTAPARRAPARRTGRHGGPSGQPTTTRRAVLTSVGILTACAVLVVAFLALDGARRLDGPGAGHVLATGPDGPAGSDGAVVAETQDATVDPADPTAAARALTERRLALVTQGAGDLSSVAVPGSPAEATDAALLAELADVDVLDARAEVFDARAVEPDAEDGVRDAEESPPDVAVEVDYAVSAHRQRTGDGEVQVAATPRTTVVLLLRWTDAGWRVAEVR